MGRGSHRAALPTPHLLSPHLSASPAPIWPMQQLDTYLPATPAAQLGLSKSSAVPYSAFPSERAARLALLAHRPRGFSPPSLSLFYRCRPLQSAPALPNPRPQFACPPQPTHNHNHKPQPPSPPPLPFLLLHASTTLFHGVRIIYSPGQSRAIRLQLPPAYQHQPGPAQSDAARDGSSQQAA